MKGHLIGMGIVAAAGLASPSSAKPKLFDEAVRAWIDCLEDNGARLSSVTVPVETVATAAFGHCKAQDSAVYQARLKRPFAARLFLGPSWADRSAMQAADDAQSAMRANFREHLIGDLVEAKLPK